MVMKIPPMKQHSTGQAWLRWEGKSKYFGKFGTPEAEERYWQWRQEIAGHKAPEQSGRSVLVVDLMERYKEAHPSKNLKDKLKAVSDLGPLARHYCHEFTPLVYRKLRDRLVATGTKCARHVNDLMRLVQRVFRWGVSMELVELDTYNRLKTVDPLKAHEVKRQSKKRQPAKREDVLKTLEELHDMPADIVRLILFTGARPGEICGMRASEVQKDGPHKTWVYRPGAHKTMHHGKRRFITFGKKGQAILRKWWPAAGDYFFPSSLIVGHYKPGGLRQAVWHACKRAGVPHWSPYGLRHLRLTEIAVDKGLEVAASVAGHGELGTTKIYQHEPDVISIRDAV